MYKAKVLLKCIYHIIYNEMNVNGIHLNQESIHYCNDNSWCTPASTLYTSGT